MQEKKPYREGLLRSSARKMLLLLAGAGLGLELEIQPVLSIDSPTPLRMMSSFADADGLADLLNQLNLLEGPPAIRWPANPCLEVSGFPWRRGGLP